MEEALALGREHRDPWSTSFALFARALVDFECGEYDNATARALAAREADATGEAGPNRAALLVLGNVALVRGDPTRALQLFDESIALLPAVCRTPGDSASCSRSRRACDCNAKRSTRHRRRQPRHCRSVRRSMTRAGLRTGSTSTRACSPRVAMPPLRRACGEQRMASLATVGGSLVPTMRWIRAHYLESVVAALGDEYESLTAEGRATPIDDAIALARACVGR